jgi:hypothetical protein
VIAAILSRERPSPFAGWVRMPIEFLHGRPLSPEDLERIRSRPSTTSMSSMTKFAALSLATGLTCCLSIHPRKIDVARKPEPPSQPATWTIYRAAKKAIRLGEVEATDEQEAIEKAAEQFKVQATKLIARLQRQ